MVLGHLPYLRLLQKDDNDIYQQPLVFKDDL